MNISQASSSNILDVQNRNRNDTRLQGGTSIQEILPIRKSSDEGYDGLGVDPAQTETAFDTVLGTLVDTINPLQHVPGVSAAYQSLTGDTQNPIAAMAGGFLFGGPVGLIAGAASSFFEMISGKSIGEHAQAFLSGDQAKESSVAVNVTSQIGDGTPMLKADQGVSLQQYQAFANAAADTNLGFGADANAVAWASNTWTTQALQQATGAYDAAQQAKNDHVSRSSKFG